LRNAVAHWELDEKMSNKNEIIICNPVTFEKLKLDDKLIEKFKEHEKFLLKIFDWEQTLREKKEFAAKEKLACPPKFFKYTCGALALFN